jgi:phosphatidylserine decarboxylase
MKIHKEGKIPILVATLLVAFSLSLYFCLKKEPPLFLTLVLILFSVCFLFHIIRFFRIPNRVINKVENGVLSPADGTVCCIEECYEKEYFKDKRLKISIFMSIYNVHVNFFPIDGTVSYVCYHAGKYFIANLPKASELNEHNSVAVKNEKGEEILFRQIAGCIARRIVSPVREGDTAIQGEEMGLIRFGSRVDVFLPLNTEISVKTGDKVRAQKTILAML